MTRSPDRRGDRIWQAPSCRAPLGSARTDDDNAWRIVQRPVISWASAFLLLTAAVSGCASAPASPSRSTVPPSAADGGASSRAWVPLGPLTEDQLWAARLGPADLPGGAVVEPAEPSTPGSAANVAAASPECAPVLAAITEKPRARWGAVYVVGNNTFGNRTEVDLGSFDPGQVRSGSTRSRRRRAAAARACGPPRERLPDAEGPGGGVRRA